MNWVTRDGKSIPPGKIEDDHLMNILKWGKDNWYEWDDSFWMINNTRVIFPYVILEAHNRGFDIGFLMLDDESRFTIEDVIEECENHCKFHDQGEKEIPKGKPEGMTSAWRKANWRVARDRVKDRYKTAGGRNKEFEINRITHSKKGTTILNAPVIPEMMELLNV